jgi:hypothetical protein
MRISFSVPIFSILQFVFEVPFCFRLPFKKAPDHPFYDTFCHTLVFREILFCAFA